MENVVSKNWIIVDDDPINSFVCTRMIEKLFPNPCITVFNEPLKALEYLEMQWQDAVIEKTVLLLDLNMPVYSGWDFLQRFEYVSPELRGKYKMFLTSALLYSEERETAKKYPFVSGFIEKPLTLTQLSTIFEN